MFDLQASIDKHKFFLGDARQAEPIPEHVAALRVQNLAIVFVLKNGRVDVARCANDADVTVVRSWRRTDVERQRR